MQLFFLKQAAAYVKRRQQVISRRYVESDSTLKHAIEYIRIRFALRNGSKQSRCCAKFTAMRYPGYAFPWHTFIYVYACVCARPRETTDVSGFAMTSFFMVAVGADRPCVHRVLGKYPTSCPGKSFLAEDEEIRAGTREMSLSLLPQSVKTIRKRLQFSFFFFRDIYNNTYTCTHTHIHIILLRANELISILDTSVKSS